MFTIPKSPKQAMQTSQRLWPVRTAQQFFKQSAYVYCMRGQKAKQKTKQNRQNQQYLRIPNLAITALAKLHLGLGGRSKKQDAIFRVKGSKGFMLHSFGSCLCRTTPLTAIKDHSDFAQVQYQQEEHRGKARVRDDDCAGAVCASHVSATTQPHLAAAQGGAGCRATAPIKYQRPKGHNFGCKLGKLTYVYLCELYSLKSAHHRVNSQPSTLLYYI